MGGEAVSESRGCNVSLMRTETMSPDPDVIAATSHIAADRPSASAVMPAMSAPIA